MNKNNEIVLSAALDHSVYQVYPVVRHGPDFWHHSLGHSSTRFRLNANEIYTDLRIRLSHYGCATCAQYNSVPTSVGNSNPKATNSNKAVKLFDLVYSLMGPLKVKSMGRKKYMITLIDDDNTRYAETNSLHKNGDTARLLKSFCERIKYDILARSGLTKAVNMSMRIWKPTLKKEVLSTRPPPPIHESNGIAEGYNQTLTGMVRPSLDDIPPSLWHKPLTGPATLKIGCLTLHLTDEPRMGLYQ